MNTNDCYFTSEGNKLAWSISCTLDSNSSFISLGTRFPGPISIPISSFTWRTALCKAFWLMIS